MSNFSKIQSNVFAGLSALVFSVIFIGASIVPAEVSSIGGLLV